MPNLKVFNLFWITILFSIVFFSVYGAYISADAPYYLAVARDISSGLMPYKDINMGYTPLMMYLNSLLYLLFDNPSYHLFLILQFLVIALLVGLFYRICTKFNLTRGKSLFLSLFLFLSILSSDGTYINLEVYVILFIMIAFLFLVDKKYFLAGVALSVGFFFKQYGLLSFVPFFLLVITYRPYQKRSLLGFIAGALLPLMIFILYYTVIENVSFINLFDQLSGRAYAEKAVASGKSLFSFSLLAGSKVFLLLLIPLFFLKINPIKNRVDGILIIGIIVNLLPVLIQYFQHYFILTYPYIFILMMRNHQNFDRKFVVISNLVLLVISVLLFLRIFRYKDVYDQQVKIAEKISEKYPEGSEVFLEGNIRYLYFLNDYRNPVLEEVGYDYGFTPDEEFREEYKVLSTKSYSSE